MENLPAPPPLQSFGHALDSGPGEFGRLRDSRDAAGDFPELRRRFAEGGHLYLPGYLDRDEVPRACLVDRLAAADVLDPAHPPSRASAGRMQAASSSPRSPRAIRRSNACCTRGACPASTASSTVRRSGIETTGGFARSAPASAPTHTATCPMRAAAPTAI